MSDSSCIPNEFPDLLSLSSSPEALRLDALRRMVCPDLDIDGHSPVYWAEAYLKGDRSGCRHRSGNCGITSERVSFLALNACLSKETTQVEQFIQGLAPILSPISEAPFPSELLCGRAGTLYLIRVLLYFVPHAELLLEETIATLNRQILDKGEDGKGNWFFHGKQYYGAAHGDIGIITQLVLTTPSLAQRLQPRLEKVLDAQFESGNWPSSAESSADRLVQFCHGAPGVVTSLLALKLHFPGLIPRIDHAVEMGRACIWERGLLRKEPSLCHGILGNALALEPGPRREHFLAVASPEYMPLLKKKDETLFESAAYGAKDSLLMNYWMSGAWTWTVWEEEDPEFILYTDV